MKQTPEMQLRFLEKSQLIEIHCLEYLVRKGVLTYLQKNQKGVLN